MRSRTGRKPFTSDAERVAFLFELYQNYTSLLPGGKNLRARGRKPKRQTDGRNTWIRSQEFGRIDVLANNAGLTIVKPAEELSEEEFDSISDVNFKGPFFASAMVAKSMIERGVKGSIINISSQVGHVGGPLRAAYAGAKGGLNSLTRSLAAEWARHGIRVTGVSPTFTRTEMMERAAQNPEFRKNFEKVPLGRPAEPEEIAAAVIYLASDAGRFVTGHTLLVDGGFTAV